MENQTAERKKVIFSAIQPSGTITLGNYLGALKNWVALQDDFDCIFALADLHTITVRQEPAKFRRNILGGLRPVTGLRDRRKQEPVLHAKPCPYACGIGVDSELLHPVWRALPHDAV